MIMINQFGSRNTFIQLLQNISIINDIINFTSFSTSFVAGKIDINFDALKCKQPNFQKLMRKFLFQSHIPIPNIHRWIQLIIGGVGIPIPEITVF